MHTKPTITFMQLSRFFFASITLLCLLSSCNSGKIAFGNTYYFPQTPREVTERMAAVPPVSGTEFTAATASVAPTSRTPAKVPQALAVAALRYQHATESLEQDDLSRTEKKALRTEKRSQKKAFKAAYKKFVSEQRSADIDDEVTGLVKAGIIIGAAGLTMLVIGILVSGGAVLTTLGGIFLAVGVVLILLRVL